jgi:iron complex outermembrane receptor protein
MQHFKLLPIPLLLVGLATSVQAREIETVRLAPLAVTAIGAEDISFGQPVLGSTADVGDLIKRLPGVHINSNGPLTPLVQIRGLSGARVNVLIDGSNLSQAGPNSMDSPLSYIPSSRTSLVGVYRGITPVSTGIETIGGTVIVESNQVDFGLSDEFELHGNASAGYASNGHARQLGLTTAFTNQHHRFQYSGSVDRGDDLDFKGGTIRTTKHDRDTLNFSYGYQNNGQQFDASVEHLDTGKTGTPSLPMDIIYFRGENYKFKFGSDLSNGGRFNLTYRYQDIDHEMDNFTYRDTPTMLHRFVTPDVEAQGISVGYDFAGWKTGVDIDQAEHNSTIFNPNDNLFFIEAFNNIERDRYSAFAEWEGALTPRWNVLAGARYSYIRSDAGKVDIMGMLPGALSNLRDNFNDEDLSQDDHLLDLAVTLSQSLSDSLDVEFGFARKTRAPSYQERYLWAPIEITAGLADDNNYIGDVNLDHEVSYQAELGFDWHTARAGISPHIFYHHINDYIQGVAFNGDPDVITVSGLAPFGGDSTPLQYSNVDARLYGLDANWYAAFCDNFRLDGTVSYVRGQRRDTGDDLYRIAPLTARTTLSYIQPNWTLGLEAETIARQNHVSDENSEQKTGGYALFNLSGQLQATQDIVITAGVNNIFNRYHMKHLGGYNRVANEDINVGDRLPGVGRSGYINFNYEF